MKVKYLNEEEKKIRRKGNLKRPDGQNHNENDEQVCHVIRIDFRKFLTLNINIVNMLFIHTYSIFERSMLGDYQAFTFKGFKGIRQTFISNIKS